MDTQKSEQLKKDTQKSEEVKMGLRMDDLASLKSFIDVKFDITKSLGNEAKAYFCTTCGGDAMKKDDAKTNHKITDGHKVIRAFKGVSRKGYCFKESALKELGNQVFDYSDIMGYTHQGFMQEMVYDITPKDTDSRVDSKKKCRSCASCRRIIDESKLYCSISCKVKSLEKEKEKEKEESTGPEAKKKRKEIVLGGGSEQSMINKAKKNAAVGQESGSGSEEKEKAKNAAPEEKGEGGEKGIDLDLRL